MRSHTSLQQYCLNHIIFITFSIVKTIETPNNVKSVKNMFNLKSSIATNKNIICIVMRNSVTENCIILCN